MDNNTLKHYGVPGMKWGVRKNQSSSGSNARLKKKIERAKLKNELQKQKNDLRQQKTGTTPAQKKTNKKKRALVIAGVTTVAVGTAIYLKNKDKINGYIKNALNKNKKTQKEQAEINKRLKDVKKRRTLSDADLKAKTDRIELEKKFKNLSDEDIAPGKKAISDILSSSGKKVAGVVVSGAMLYAIKVAMTKKVDANDAAGYIAPKPKNK